MNPLTDKQRSAYDLVFHDGIGVREVGRRWGVSHVAILKLCRKAQAKVDAIRESAGFVMPIDPSVEAANTSSRSVTFRQ